MIPELCILSPGGHGPQYSKIRHYVLKSVAPIPGADAPPSLVNVPYRDNVELPTLVSPVFVSTYSQGCIVHWKPKPCKPKGGALGGIRGPIAGMSPKARSRASFAFGNAPFAWAWMVTLTYQVQPVTPGDDWKRFLRKLRAAFDCDCQYGWVMEYQERGVVHYHLFLGSDFVGRNGFDRSCWIGTGSGHREGEPVIRGLFDDWLVREWVASVENPSSVFREFQTRGICEPFRSPDAAARYVAKEAGKGHQKALPPDVDGGRRWWWLSDEGRPVKEGTEKLVQWPLGTMVSRVYDKSLLRDCFAHKTYVEGDELPF